MADSSSALLMRGLSLSESEFSHAQDSAIGGRSFTMDNEREQPYEDDARFRKISGGREKNGAVGKTDTGAKVGLSPHTNGSKRYGGVTDSTTDGHDTDGSGGGDGGGGKGNSGLGVTNVGAGETEDDVEVEIGDVTGKVVEVWNTNGGRRGPRCIGRR